MFMVLLLACQWSLNAQNAKLKKARYLMESLHYQGAIDIYQQILEKNEDPEAITNLAIAFKKTTEYQAALPWFAKAVTLESAKPEVFYYYGQALQHSGSCEEAKIYYDQYLKLRPYDLRREQLENPCQELEKIADKAEDSYYVVKGLPINGPFDDLGPAFYQNGLVFGAIKEANSRRKTAFFDLYFAKQLGGDVYAFEEAAQFSSALNSKLHEAIVTFNPQETQVYITRNRQEELDPRRNPVVRLEILSAEKSVDGVWSNPAPLPFNDPSYSVAHPCLSASGDRLFFSSDMPGGFGGKDVYMSFWDGVTWGGPINLGPGINTEGDELSPFYHSDGQLYFASDGHFGLGGQDIYKVDDIGNGQWSNVKNLGPPINTAKDDFGFIIHPEGGYGYFTSNRAGGKGGDDIYGFKWEAPIAMHAYRFKVVDGVEQSPLEMVTAKVKGKEQFLVADAAGFFQLDIPVGDCFNLAFAAIGYEEKEWQDCARKEAGSMVQEITIGLRKVPVIAEKTTPDVMYFDLEVVDNLSGTGVKGAHIKVENGDCDFNFEGDTDESGWIRISAPAICCSRLTVQADNYFLHKSEKVFCDVNKGEVRNISLQPYVRVSEEEVTSRSLASNPQDTVKVPFKVSAGSAKGDNISYLLNIYYNVGRTSVKKESVSELFRLLALLQENPELIVEIGSHTDARGGASFNQNLSQRRATNIVNFLVGEGVSKRRLIAKGYGEGKPVNDCVDGKECEEEEYQMNRRTEFRVIGRLD